jgi:4'-phosphopantetheinyl transferase
MTATPTDPDPITVWFVPLETDEAVFEKNLQLLSDDEHTRAQRFHFDKDRHHFVNCRATLRKVLADITGHSADTLTFRYAEHGKPYLEGPRSEVFFNVSHTHGMGLVASRSSGEIGVDLEPRERKVNYPELAKGFFSPAETETLLALPQEEQQEAFIRCWTRKEAYMKARGAGISMGLSTFDVSFAPGDQPCLLRTETPGDADAWSLHDLSTVEGFIAALCLEGAGGPIETSTWSHLV